MKLTLGYNLQATKLKNKGAHVCEVTNYSNVSIKI